MNQAVFVIVIMIVTILLFVFEVFPLGITAFLTATVLYMFGIIDEKMFFEQLVNKNTLLIAGMCILGNAFFVTGMAKKAGNLITNFAKTERSMIVGVMCVAGIMSAFLSNFGTIACLMPICIGMATSKGIKPIKLLIPLCAAATVGGCCTLSGSPGNLTAKTVIEKMSGGVQTVTFWEYGRVGFPMLIAVILVMALWGTNLIPDRQGENNVTEKKDFSDVPEWKGYITLVVFILSVIGMSLTGYIKWLPPMHIIVSFACLILVLSRAITQKQAFDSIDLQTIFLITFVTPLGTALKTSGASAMIADNVKLIFGNSSPIIITAVIWLVTWCLTQVMSNMATAALFCPVAWEIGIAIGVDPRAAVIAALFGSSVAVCTPIAMPGDTMIMGPAGARFGDFFKSGILMSVASFLISMILLPIFYPF
ncbi:SLC13 family permease [Acidaminococcus sp. DS4831]|uniref:SLC13 family permease n=1 Tax=Acidaminococcus sp. DS4831 TaxID=3141399 RepID=UPI0032E50DF5